MGIAEVASQLCDPRERPHPYLCFCCEVLSCGGKATGPPGDPESSAVSKECCQQNTGGTVVVSGGAAHVGSSQDNPGKVDRVVREQIRERPVASQHH